MMSQGSLFIIAVNPLIIHTGEQKRLKNELDLIANKLDLYLYIVYNILLLLVPFLLFIKYPLKSEYEHL